MPDFPATTVVPDAISDDPGRWRRPALLPGLARVRRSDGTLQLGVEPPLAHVVTGLGTGTADLIDALDGTRDRSQLQALAAAAGLGPPDLDELLRSLAAAGLLFDAASGPALAGLPDEERARLQPDLVALGLRVGAGRHRDAFARRRRAWVEVRGAGRVGSSVAVLLASAGVGRVTVRDQQPVRPADHCPTGMTGPGDQPGPGNAGSSREDATRRRITAVAPSTAVARSGDRDRPSLTVLAPVAGPDPALAVTWSRRAIPHVLAYVRENRGVAGPLVEPGRGCCLFCLHLHQRDRDPYWSVEGAQARAAEPSTACDVTLAGLVATQVAMQSLSYLDVGTSALIDATLETTLDSGLSRRRVWPAHPGCSCRWSALVASPSEFDDDVARSAQASRR